jgi:threonyl-tRNA synthetase
MPEMPHKPKKSKSRALAEAALLLSQRVHACYPQAVMTPLEVPYTDEDLTVDVSVPEDYSIREVSDTLIRLCLEIEDALGISILTQVSRLPHKAPKVG